MEGTGVLLPQPQPQFQRQFTFVDANDRDPQSARIANSHAMREWKRAKKWRDSHMSRRLGGRRKVRSLEWRKKDAGPLLPKEDESHREGAYEEDSVPISLEHESVVSTGECYLGRPSCKGQKCCLAPFSPSEKFLKADVIDPFSSVFPVRLDSKMRALIHYLFVVVPFQVYGYPEEIEMNPLSKHFLTTASMAPAACHILLAHSAFVLAAMRGQMLSLEGQLHKTKAITLINEALDDPSKRYDDAMLTAVTCLGRLETRWGSKEVGDMHMVASQQILMARGGRDSLRQNHELDLQTSWGEISMAADQAATFHARRREGGARIRTPSNMDEQELHQSTHELVHFLHQLEVRLHEDKTDLERDTTLSSCRLASSSSWAEVYNLLEAPGNNAIVHIKERIIRPSSRLACLLNVNTVLLEYVESPSEATVFFVRVNELVVKHRVQKLELLQWLLDSVLGDNPVRRWRVVRMVKATELLSPQLRHAVSRFLFDNLPAARKQGKKDRHSITPYLEPILAEFGEILSPLRGDSAKESRRQADCSGWI